MKKNIIVFNTIVNQTGTQQSYSYGFIITTEVIKPEEYFATSEPDYEPAGNEIESRTRILMNISGGKPDNDDNNRGEYDIEDTRQALIETWRDGSYTYYIKLIKSSNEH